MSETYRTFQKAVSKTIVFNIGYYDGNQQAKVWLVVPDDLNSHSGFQ